HGGPVGDGRRGAAGGHGRPSRHRGPPAALHPCAARGQRAARRSGAGAPLFATARGRAAGRAVRPRGCRGGEVDRMATGTGHGKSVRKSLVWSFAQRYTSLPLNILTVTIL